LARVSADVTGQSQAERLLLGLQAADAARAVAISAPEAAEIVRAALGDGSLLAQVGPNSPIYTRLLVELSGLQEQADDRYDRELDNAADEARRRGAWTGLATILSFRCINARLRGRLITAEADARTAVDVASQMGWLADVPFPLYVLIDVLTEAGDFGEAERLLEANGFLGALAERPHFPNLLGARGRLRLAQGRFDEGLADLEENLARVHAGKVTSAVLPAPLSDVSRALVPALVQVGRGDEAREIADELLRLARSFGNSRYIAYGLRDQALACADGPDIEQLWDAVAIYERINTPIALARTLMDIGSALRRRRQPAGAREPLRQALDLARKCGARPIAERAEHELRATGARPRRDRITGRDALTATEQRVAQLAIDGMTNRQIAETLFVTRKTVESHLDHIFHKLGIHTRGELEPALAGEDQGPRARKDDRPSPERVQRAFMFTDIVDSTPLVSILGDDAWVHLLQWHDRTLRELFGSYRGQEVDHSGDGFFVAFERADAAVRCAEEIQRKLERHRLENGFAPQVRIGVHLDAANYLAGDYSGQGVHLAARIGAQAQAGEVLISRATLKAIARPLNLGQPRTTQLKGFNSSIELVPVIWT
jgi:class 3 adenylate cyclase